jgi:hypothetical protein
MPKRNRSIDRRPQRKEEAPEEGEDSGNAEDLTPDRRAPVDVVAFCAACGCNDPAEFSKRMLQRQGRFGERTRRCKACVAASEAEGQTSQKLSSEIADKWEAAQAKQRQSASGWERAAKATSVEAANAQSGLLVRAISKQVEEQMMQAREEKEEGKKRKRLLKQLSSIADLKERLADGEPLEATQRDKIARESSIEAELMALDEEDGGGDLEQTASSAAVSVKRPRPVPDDETRHHAGAMAAADDGAPALPPPKKLKAKPRKATESDASSALMAHLLKGSIY